MHTHILVTAVAAFLSIASAQGIDAEDVPPACQTTCQPVVARSNFCDQQFDGDARELNCICTGPGMVSAIRQCEACSRGRTEPDGDAYKDPKELLKSCGFNPITTSAARATAAVATPRVTVYTTTSTEIEVDDGTTSTDRDVEVVTSTIGAPAPSLTTFTTTTTDDDGEVETEVETETITSTPTPPAAQAARLRSGRILASQNAAGGLNAVPVMAVVVGLTGLTVVAWAF